MTIIESLYQVNQVGEDGTAGRIEFLVGQVVKDCPQCPQLSCPEPNVLALGNAHLRLEGGRSIASPGDLAITAGGALTIGGRNIAADGQSWDAHLAAADNPHKVTTAQIGALALSGGTLTGALTVKGDLTVTGTGTINGRNITADGSKLDVHVAAIDNPHKVNAAQIGALALSGGTLTGALTVKGDLTVTGTGTINSRNIAADGSKLDAHVAATDNPHKMTAAQIGALALSGGTLTGALTVKGALVANQGVMVGSKEVIDRDGNWVGGGGTGGNSAAWGERPDPTHPMVVTDWHVNISSARSMQSAMQVGVDGESGWAGEFRIRNTFDRWAALYAENGGLGSAAELLVDSFRPENISPALVAGRYNSVPGLAALFLGDVEVRGRLSKSSGGFRIDHPLDPENRYLNHSFVESPDMKNVYDGVAFLDDRGEASVELPSYFEALNCDLRYQLTAIGAPAPNLHIAEKMRDNSFRIAGGVPGMEVSWQVTGIRQDPVANANRLPVEQAKEPEELGTYLHPRAYGQPAERGIPQAKHAELPKMP